MIPQTVIFHKDFAVYSAYFPKSVRFFRILAFFGQGNLSGVCDAGEVLDILEGLRYTGKKTLCQK